MSGIADLHVLTALQNGYQQVTGGAEDAVTTHPQHGNVTQFSLSAGQGSRVGEIKIKTTATEDITGDVLYSVTGLVDGHETVVTYLLANPNSADPPEFTITDDGSDVYWEHVSSVSVTQSAGLTVTMTHTVTWVAQKYLGHGYINFARMFPGVSVDLKKEWWDALISKDVAFRANAAPGHADFPVVVVQLLSESVSETPIGMFSGRLPKTMGKLAAATTVVQQSLLVTSMANNAEVARCLFVVVRNILLSYHHQFLKVGYLEFAYAGAEELTPEEELVADDMGVFVRKQRYDTTSQIDAYPLDAPNTAVGKEWWVQTKNIKTVAEKPEDPNNPTRRVQSDDGERGGVIEIT